MRARFEVATRLAVACLVLITIAVAGGCGGGGGPGSNSGIAFTKAALTSVPLVRPPAPVAASLQAGAPVAPTLVAASLQVGAPTSIDTDWFTNQLFKMECREAAGNQGVDYCLAGTPPQSAYGTALGSDPYAFDMQALVGFIYHAQLYTSLITECSGAGLTPKTVTKASYQAHDASNPSADPARFIFDEYGTYSCRSTQVSDTTHETRMVSAVADGSYQTTLHTRYQYAAGGEVQTDFFQVDVSMNAGSPEFLAFNFASAAPFASRLVLLVNLTKHKFAMKYYTPAQNTAPERYAVAAGTAGYDFTTGNPNTGQYYVHFSDQPWLFEECVDNVGGVFESDFTQCDADLGHTAWSPAAIQTFLSIPAAAAARIGDYLAVFGNTNDLASTDNWSTAASTDPDMYWPATLN